jgi:hypothetical protein
VLLPTLIVLVAALACYRLLLGVPRPRHPSALLSRGEVAFLEAAAAAFVPAIDPETGAGLARPGQAVEITRFADRYAGSLPARQRRLIRAMLVFFEQSTLIFPARGIGGFRRFSKLTPEQRAALLEAWAESPWAWRRSLLTALRAFVVMGVLGHPDNLRGLGLEPWDITSPIIESDLLYPPIGESRASISLTEDDLTPVRDTTPLRAVGSDAS